MKIGRRLRGSEAIELVGDLGAGKTAFVRGLAKGMGSRDTVSSPSFTLSNLYRAEKLSLYHFDLYRLEESGLIKRELAETLEDPNAVVVVEWGSGVQDVIPSKHLTITITTIGDDSRKFNFTYPEGLNYLMPENS